MLALEQVVQCSMSRSHVSHFFMVSSVPYPSPQVLHCRELPANWKHWVQCSICYPHSLQVDPSAVGHNVPLQVSQIALASKSYLDNEFPKSEVEGWHEVHPGMTSEQALHYPGLIR
jgi:hypothetical protein